MKIRLLIVVNDPAFFISHRLPVAEGARDAGYCVHIATAAGPAVAQIHRRGFTHHVLPMTRSGTNPIQELRTFFGISLLLRRLRPSIVHFVTIKPVVYGGIAARVAKVPGAVLAISGLGTAFTDNDISGLIRRHIIRPLYRAALSHRNARIIVQNHSDLETLRTIARGVSLRFIMVPGSGVDLAEYQHTPEARNAVPVIVMAARLLREKGVHEFIRAAEILLLRGITARFLLVGDPDPGNPTSVSPSLVAEWRESGPVEILGHRNDIPALFSAANIVCLPSYYGEGIPKVLLEAAACGRAIITTDHPGCRDAILPGVTGILVPPRSALALADAVQSLVENTELRNSMGVAGRLLAESKYSVVSVVEQHLEAYRQLAAASSSK